MTETIVTFFPITHTYSIAYTLPVAATAAVAAAAAVGVVAIGVLPIHDRGSRVPPA